MKPLNIYFCEIIITKIFPNKKQINSGERYYLHFDIKDKRFYLTENDGNTLTANYFENKDVKIIMKVNE